MSATDIIIVGGKGGTNIGESFERAARKLGVRSFFLDHETAYQSHKLIRALYWRAFQKLPPRINLFERSVLKCCRELRPEIILTTGLSPIREDVLDYLGELGIRRCNYLTDDPWNPAHFSAWFLKALKKYDNVFSVRHANMNDLESLKGPNVHYLPFGYDVSLFYPEMVSVNDSQVEPCDVLFVGGADKDRYPFMEALVKNKINLKIFGSYWERYSEIKPYSYGQADPTIIRHATIFSKISVCLVRRANRDDNCMRSFEIAAMKGCLLLEDTCGHRDLFGGDEKKTAYFKDPKDLVEQVKRLLLDGQLRESIRCHAYDVVTKGSHTYEDRFKTIFETMRVSRANNKHAR